MNTKKKIVIIGVFVGLVLLAFSLSYIHQTSNATPSAAAIVAKQHGKVYMDKEQYDQAIAAFTEALRINPQDAEAYVLRGMAYSTKKQHAQVIADFTTALRLNFQGTEDCKVDELYCLRGMAYDNIGQFEQSIADYNMALRFNPQCDHAYLNKGMAYDGRGNKSEAINAYREFLRCASPDEASWVERVKQRISDLGG